MRFVVLRHEGFGEPHFDLMFETAPGSALASWRAGAWPVKPGDCLVKVADHRPAYLTFEGPVSGGRGAVRRVAEGRCTRVRLEGGLFEAIFEDGVVLELVRDVVPGGPTRWSCRT